MTTSEDFPPFYLDFSANPDDAPGWGYLDPDFALVGMAPSPTRPAHRFNEPFGAKSWTTMQRIINNLGGKVYLTNLVKYPLPVRKKIPKKIIRAVTPSLIEELKFVNPKRVIAFGAQVAEVLCPGFESMTEDHGTLFWNPELNAVVVPTFHPSAVARDPSRSSFMVRDLQRAYELPDPVPPVYEVVETAKQLNAIVKWMPDSPMVFLDIETEGTVLEDEGIRITMISWTWEFQPKVYIIQPDLDDPDRYLKKIWALRKILDDHHAIIVGHNLPFDLAMLSYKSGEFWNFPVRDTMSMAFVLGEEFMSLKHLTSKHTQRSGSRAFGGYEDLSYAAEDVYSTRELYFILEPKCRDIFALKLYEQLIIPIVGMTVGGTYVDPELIDGVIPEYRKIVDREERRLQVIAGRPVNWNSTQQVSALFLELGIPLTEMTDAGAYSVKESVLKSLALKYDIAQSLLDFRENQTFLEFLEDWKERARVSSFLHPKMKIYGTTTARTSCVDPNLQNVPRVGKLKTVFISRHEYGRFGIIDLSQAELRAVGLLSGDEDFCRMLLASDPHLSIASVVWRLPQEEITGLQRKKSKAVTFGLLYGGSVRGMAFRSGFDEREVEMVKTSLFEQFPGLKRYITHTQNAAISSGFVQTAFGKVRDLRPLIEMYGERDAKRKAVNTPIQGTASEVMLWIISRATRLMRQNGLITRPLVGIHDSMLLDVYPKEEDAVAEILGQAFLSLSETPLAKYRMFDVVPFAGDFMIGESWASVESTNEHYHPLAKFSLDSHKGYFEKTILEVTNEE